VSPAGNATPRRVPFLLPGLREDEAAVRAAIDRVVASGWYILGPEVEAFEAELAAACGTRHAVGVGNGTDAIALVLRALGIGPGDEVVTTPLSAAFTALAIMMVGARPVFADIEAARLTIEPAAVEHAVTARTRAILPVHLYGQPADMDGLQAVAAAHGLALVEDCCQAHLALSRGRPVGTIGVAGALSFYPTKNLGALGDGGAVVTNDAGLADRVRRLRHGGQSVRYWHLDAGVNSRLDEVQAAVLRARLPFLRQWTEKRRALASHYRAALADALVDVPPELEPGHVYHLFVVLSGIEGGRDRRAALQAHLAAEGIETLVHYPVPIPEQPAMDAVRPDACPVAASVCRQLLSLPLHPWLGAEAVDDVAAACRRFR
jgi:dTDP-3-amino-3,4,6-trideoxy-alpha-D-glucose transaminase